MGPLWWDAHAHLSGKLCAPLTSWTFCRASQLCELPEELLWTMLGFLDVPALCTARLVCKRFRKCGAAHFKTLQLDCATLEEQSNPDFTQFPAVTRLSVRIKEINLHLLLQPSLAPGVTHVDLFDVRPRGKRDAGNMAQLALLPNLCSVSLSNCNPRMFQLLPAGLKELILLEPVGQNASHLTKLSALTSLVLHGDEAGAATPPLTGLAGLTNLRSLQLSKFPSPLAVLSTFTMLSSLTWDASHHEGPEPAFLELVHLTGLSTLKVSTREWKMVGREELACIACLTNLTSLDMCGYALAPGGAPASALEPLTRLVSLGLFRGQFRNLLPLAGAGYQATTSFLPSLNLEGLHSLTVPGEPMPVALLQRATALTHLVCLCPGDNKRKHGLGAALAGMPGLRSLSLCTTHETLVPFNLGRILRPLTNLTKLEYCGFIKKGDLAACASLPALRCLTLNHVLVTPAWLPGLLAMSGLASLTFSEEGSGLSFYDMKTNRREVTGEVRAAFDAKRPQWGWPPLKLTLGERWG
jgi:hypothetical protein